MMTKVRKLRWVVMMASALIVTFAVNNAIAQTSWQQRQWEKGKEIKKKGEEFAEKAKELKAVAMQTKEEVDKFNVHSEEFWDTMGPQDLIGRSFPHFLFIAIMWSGVLLILYRKEDFPQSTAHLAVRSVAALVPAATFGVLYEMLRSSNINQLMEVADSAPDLPIVTEVAGTYKFFYYAQYVLPGLAGLTLAYGLSCQRRRLHRSRPSRTDNSQEGNSTKSS